MAGRFSEDLCGFDIKAGGGARGTVEADRASAIRLPALDDPEKGTCEGVGSDAVWAAGHGDFGGGLAIGCAGGDGVPLGQKACCLLLGL